MGKTAVYMFHGGQPPTCTSKVHHNLGGLGVVPQGNFLILNILRSLLAHYHFPYKSRLVESKF